MLALLLASAAAVATPADTSACSTVSPVTTATDIAGLQRDADCFGAAAASDRTARDVLSKAASSATASQKYRLDRIAWLKAHPVTPPPVVPTQPVLSPTLAGLAPIATTDFDPLTAIAASSVPPINDDVLGAFRFICGPGHFAPNDPVMVPGKPGASHLHQFFGNDSVDADSTYASLRAAGHSTCDNVAGQFNNDALYGHALDRSGYWLPAMLDGKGNAVNFDFTQIYYKRRPTSDPKCSLTSGDATAEGNCIDLPNGLRFIFGYDMMNPAANDPAHPRFNWICSAGPNGNPAKTYINLAEVAKVCNTPGNQIEVQLQAYHCWDGKHLDTADHRSHMAYEYNTGQGYFKCPAGYPYILPSFIEAVFWTVREGDDVTKWSLSSDAAHPELPAGSTMHTDFFEAWDPQTKARWQRNCIDKKLSCTGGILGDGTSLNGAWMPFWRLPTGWQGSFSAPPDKHLVPLSSLPAMKM